MTNQDNADVVRSKIVGFISIITTNVSRYSKFFFNFCYFNCLQLASLYSALPVRFYFAGDDFTPEMCSLWGLCVIVRAERSYQNWSQRQHEEKPTSTFSLGLSLFLLSTSSPLPSLLTLQLNAPYFPLLPLSLSSLPIFLVQKYAFVSICE